MKFFRIDASKLLIASARRLLNVVGNVRTWNWNWSFDAVAKALVLNAGPLVYRGSSVMGVPLYTMSVDQTIGPPVW